MADAPTSLPLRAIGIVAVAAIVFGCWYSYDNYGQFANIGRWTGDRGLNWIRPWLTEFRMPLLCIAGFLGLTGLSWLWAKLKLGH
ncbi:MAG: hypothetical protein AB8B85_05370 [Paracoccaceae bacterium]